MEDLSIALVCLFCVFFIMAPLTGAITSHRRAKRANVADPGPEQLLRARRKLSTVTACSSIVAPPVMSAASGGGSDNHNHDVEATAAQLELGECPICIGPLVPEPALLDGRSIRRALDELTTLATDRRQLPGPAWKWKKKRDGKGKVGGDGEDGDDDVLTLNSCRHAFHSRCLASWFLMERYDCPVCRVVYYRRPSLPERAVATRGFYIGARGRVMGLG